MKPNFADIPGLQRTGREKSQSHKRVFIRNKTKIWSGAKARFLIQFWCWWGVPLLVTVSLGSRLFEDS